MANESKGVLGHLPPLPRPALNNSVIGMEQAYRHRLFAFRRDATLECRAVNRVLIATYVALLGVFTIHLYRFLVYPMDTLDTWETHY